MKGMMMGQPKDKMTKAELQSKIEAESPKKQQSLIMGSMMFSVISLVWAGLFLGRFDSAVKAQSWAEDRGYAGDNAYDEGCVDNIDFVPTEYQTAAAGYYAVFKWAPSECDGDEECWARGTQWSHLYITLGIVYLLLCIQMMMVACGARKAGWRIAASMMSCPLGCAQFAMVIVVGIYRFRAAGKLCALSEQPTNWTSSTEVDDFWTYEQDGRLIMAWWIFTLITMFMCGSGCGPIARMPYRMQGMMNDKQ